MNGLHSLKRLSSICSSTCHTAYFSPTVCHEAHDFYLKMKAVSLLKGWYAHIRQYYGVINKYYINLHSPEILKSLFG